MLQSSTQSATRRGKWGVWSKDLVESFRSLAAKVFKILFGCTAVAAVIAAQAIAPSKEPDSTQAATSKGSIYGTVRDSVSGRPVAGARVVLSGGSSSAQTDEEGHYEIKNQPAGAHVIRVFSNHGLGPHGIKSAFLAAGQNVSVDFRLRPMGLITGRVVDQNDEPVIAADVALVAREYQLGRLRYVYAGFATTNDEGQYALPGVEPEVGFLLVVKKSKRDLQAVSDAPADVKLRKKAFEPTWYPDSDSLTGAQVLSLRPGEQRENVDIRMLRTASYCVDGVLSAEAGPGPLSFEMEEREPTRGPSGDRGVFITSSLGGQVGAGGKIRICNLHPGVYRLTAFRVPDNNQDGSMFFGETEVEVGSKDVHNISLAARATVDVSAEVVWSGKSPDPPVPGEIGVWLDPRARAPFSQEMSHLEGKIPMPGRLTLSGLLVGDYAVRVYGVPNDSYVKDVVYGGFGALYEPMHVGGTMGSDLRIVLGRDGGTLSVKVTDKDGNPVPDCNVVLLPADVSTEAALAARLIRGQTDQYGSYTYKPLAPGKYFALATDADVNLTPESMAKLLQARTHAQEVELGPSVTMQISMSPADLVAER
jgi:hypothetical protein